jgi:hypothetical protein
VTPYVGILNPVGIMGPSNFAFDWFDIRVPMIVVSLWIKRGTGNDIQSLLRPTHILYLIVTDAIYVVFVSIQQYMIGLNDERQGFIRK